MLTAIKIQNANLSGKCAIQSSNSISIIVQQPSNILLSLNNNVLTKSPATTGDTGILYTINNIQPDAVNGNFFILGSECTSIVDHSDSSDIQAMPDSAHQLKIFDGCFPCNTCNTIAQLQEDIQNCQIWINGLKDCNLYQQPAAARLWTDMLEKKQTFSNGCKVVNTVLNDRSSDFGQAIKLLYQYKASVAMWNYLVRTKAGITQILTAPEDYSGFIIQSKRNIDSCGRDSAGNPKFQITVILQSGQTQDYLQNKNCGIGFYINKVDENSYIQYGRDTGMSREQNPNNIVMTVLSVQDIQNGQIQIQIRFTFSPTKKAASIFAASVKILPVIYKLGYNYRPEDEETQENASNSSDPYIAPENSPVQLNLQRWVIYRSYATTIEQAMQTQKNRWFIHTVWATFSQQPDIEQDFYYHTAYSKYMIAAQSDSLSPIQED